MKKYQSVIFIYLSVLGFSNFATAHSGGTDKDGCHFRGMEKAQHCHTTLKDYTRHLVEIEKVVDGDTVYIENPVYGETKIRLDAIDTPEVFSSSCEREKEMGKLAKEAAEDFLDSDEIILITNGKKGKYGRLIARLEVDGVDFGQAMLSKGLAVRYTDDWVEKPKHQRWCD